MPEQTGELGPCQWCGAASVSKAIVEPAIFTSVGGVRRMKKHAIEADVCTIHAAMVQRHTDARDAAAEDKRKAAAAARRATR